MKKLILIIAISVITSECFHSTTSATLLSGPTCAVTADVIYKGSETLKAYGANGEVSGEYEFEYLKLKILKTKKSGEFGNCGFVKVGNVFKTDSGYDIPDPLNVGDRIEVGVELATSNAPTNEQSFIEWQPISVIGQNKSLPSGFSLQGSSKPEISGEKVDGNTKFLEEDSTSGLNILNIVFFAVLTLLAGGILYFLVSRQRKT